jgi:hypothetical protein
MNALPSTTDGVNHAEDDDERKRTGHALEHLNRPGVSQQPVRASQHSDQPASHSQPKQVLLLIEKCL